MYIFFRICPITYHNTNFSKCFIFKLYFFIRKIPTSSHAVLTCNKSSKGVNNEQWLDYDYLVYVLDLYWETEAVLKFGVSILNEDEKYYYYIISIEPGLDRETVVLRSKDVRQSNHVVRIRAGCHWLQTYCIYTVGTLKCLYNVI